MDEQRADGAATLSVEAVFREEHGRLLAALVRRFGDLDLAEEVASEAIEAALVRWPADGVPRRPGRLADDHGPPQGRRPAAAGPAYADRLAVLQVEADRAGRAPPPTPTGDDCPTSGCSSSSPAPIRRSPPRTGAR